MRCRRTRRRRDADANKKITLTVKGDAITMMHDQAQDGTFKLNDENHRHLTVTEDGKAETHLGIYKVDGTRSRSGKSHLPRIGRRNSLRKRGEVATSSCSNGKGQVTDAVSSAPHSKDGLIRSRIRQNGWSKRILAMRLHHQSKPDVAPPSVGLRTQPGWSVCGLW